MAEATRNSGKAERDLLARYSEMIEGGQAAAACQAKLVLTLSFWQFQRLSEDVSGSARASCREQSVVSQARQMPWIRSRALLASKTREARALYVQEPVSQGESICGLWQLIVRKSYERCAIAKAHAVGETVARRGAFHDPYRLGFCGLGDPFQERDRETMIIWDLEALLTESGNVSAFVEWQKRMIIDDDDYDLDLLFFSRPLRRLATVERKTSKLQVAYEGRIKLYLRCLARYDEKSQMVLILCTAGCHERIELLQIYKDGILVAEYCTVLSPKAELQGRNLQISTAAAERVVGHGLESSSGWEDNE